MIPVADYKSVNPTSGSLVLRVEGNQIREVGTVTEPQNQNFGGNKRTIVIGDQLWSLSQAGVQVNARNGLSQQAWLPF